MKKNILFINRFILKLNLKKIVIVVTILSIIALIISIYLINQKSVKVNDKIKIKNNTWNTIEKKEKSEEDVIKDRIDILRKRTKVKWLINSWNSYLEWEYYIFALRNYLKANMESPNDKDIINKIWYTYFSMKNFTRAYWYYRKIANYNRIDKDVAILSLFYSKELTKSNFWYIKDEINYFKLNEEKTFYYKNSLNCINDFSKCKLDFSNYIEKIEKSWKKLETKELISIKGAFSNYHNFKVDDLWYKNALIVWTFFKNKLYPVAIKLWKDILVEKQNYKPILLIIWKSYYELWKYSEAKKYLSSYIDLEPNDKDVLYLLWIINFELKEYVISNVLLQTSMEKGFTPTINIRRRTIYNFSEMWETEKMLNSFRELIENEKKLDANDLYLYIYYNIENGELDEAERISIKWIEKFPNDSNFYGYLWWVQKEKWNMIQAEKNLLKWLEINPKNPMINLNLWEIEMNKEDFEKAREYFKITIYLDKTEDFSSVAKDNLIILEEQIKEREEKLLKNDWSWSIDNY